MTARLIGFPKNITYRNKRIREAARGKDCLVCLPGCLGNPEATIWSHYRGSAGGKGMSIKADDLAGCFACTHCDAVFDGQRPRPEGMTFQDVLVAWFIGHIQSIVILHAEGII